MVNKYARAKNLLKEKDDNLRGEDIREGITAIISVRLRDPQFEGQTKAKLGNTCDARRSCSRPPTRSSADWFEENPTEANKIVEEGDRRVPGPHGGQEGARRHPLQDAARRRRHARQAQGLLARRTARSASCSSSRATPPAAPPSRPAIPRRQAILPIRGKILNVERARLDKMLKNLEIQALISAIGAGVGEEFDVEKRRYDKIMHPADADVDGQHIRTLLLTFFFRQMKPLVEHGHVYIASRRCTPPRSARRRST